jgi:hypothetical protein
VRVVGRERCVERAREGERPNAELVTSPGSLFGRQTWFVPLSSSLSLLHHLPCLPRSSTRPHPSLNLHSHPLLSPSLPLSHFRSPSSSLTFPRLNAKQHAKPAYELLASREEMTTRSSVSTTRRTSTRSQRKKRQLWRVRLGRGRSRERSRRTAQNDSEHNISRITVSGSFRRLPSFRRRF